MTTGYWESLSTNGRRRWKTTRKRKYTKFNLNDRFLFVSWIYRNWCCSICLKSLAAQFQEIKALNPCHTGSHLRLLRVHLIREYTFYDHIWLCHGFISQLMLLYLFEEVPTDQQLKAIRQLRQVRHPLRRCHREYNCHHGICIAPDVVLHARKDKGKGKALVITSHSVRVVDPYHLMLLY